MRQRAIGLLSATTAAAALSLLALAPSSVAQTGQPDLTTR